MMDCCGDKACFAFCSYTDPASFAGPWKYQQQSECLTVSDDFILQGAEAGPGGTLPIAPSCGHEERGREAVQPLAPTCPGELLER